MKLLFTRRRAVTVAVALSLVAGAFTFLSGRRTSRAGADPVAVPQDTVTAPDTTKSPPAPVADSSLPRPKYRAGEDPDFAARKGWPVNGPAPLAGALLPGHRIVAYYGNPLSKRMGVLGEYEPQEMLKRFDNAIAEWNKADPATPGLGALHLVAVVAQNDPGPSGKYRAIMRDSLVEQVYGWATSRGAILFLDIQTGHSTIRDLVPRFDHFLMRPDVHLALDPEFMMKSGHKPGAKIGTMDAADINFASAHLAQLVKKHSLPQKVLVIHRFTRGMLTNAKSITLRPEVQIVIDMDGWGAPWLKRDSYKDYVVSEPVQYTGFKLFYHNDTKKGDPLLTPDEVLKLRPAPLYIQYQ